MDDEMIENEGMDDEMIEQEDGSVLIPDEALSDENVPPPPFSINLATILPPGDLIRIGNEIFDLIELDKQSREKRDKQYAEGIQRTGLGNDAPGGGEFEGASKVVHPVMAEACVDYSAATTKEVLPPGGPVKTHLLPGAMGNPQIIEAAEAKRDFYNWQLTKQIPEYYTEMEVLFTQQPLGGSQFIKFWYDPIRKRPTCEFIPIDKVYLPYGINSFYNTPRLTIELGLNKYEFQRRVDSGMYIDADGSYFSFPEETKSEQATNKVQGQEQGAINEDGNRIAYDVYIQYDCEGKGELPYIITVDGESRKPIAIYRNWEEEDESHEKCDWVIEFPFIPWRGPYGIGLMHLIGSLSAAATGALRALLDSAHIQNFPGAMKLKGSRSSGQNIPVAPTEIVEIDAPANVDDIRKVVMANPFPGPSTVLFSLLGFVVEAAKGVVTTAEEKISDAGNQMPVGTTLALIEQGSKVFSSIHARQHRAQAKVLEVLDRINRQNFDEEVQIKAFGRVLVPIEGFRDISNICPVSDPNIFSESQRFAQMQGIQQLAGSMPELPWNKMAIAQRTLRLMHVDNADEILPTPPKPVSADPDTEISAAMQGQQIQAMPQMDHIQHIQEELTFLLDPVFGAANPVIMNPGFGVIMTDVLVHLQMLRMTIKQQAQQMAFNEIQAHAAQRAVEGGVPPDAIVHAVQLTLQQPQVAQAARVRAMEIMQQQVQAAGLPQIVELIQQADQLVKAKMPPPQMPPEAQVQLQLGQAEIQRKAQKDQMDNEVSKADASRRAQAESAQLALKQEAAQLEGGIARMETILAQQQQEFNNMVELARQRAEEQVALLAQQIEQRKNQDDNYQHQMTELAKNHEDNQTNLMLEQMRQEGAVAREEMTKKYDAFQAQLDRVLEAALADKVGKGEKE